MPETNSTNIGSGFPNQNLAQPTPSPTPTPETPPIPAPPVKPTTPATPVTPVTPAAPIAPIAPIAPAAPAAKPDPIPPIKPTIPEPPMPEIKKTGPRKRKMLGIIIGVIVGFILIGTTGVSALVAYGVIPVNNAGLKKTLSSFVLGLPFTPKTPEYILNSSQEANKKIKTGYIDASFAFEGYQPASLTGLLGISTIDFVFKGPFDLTDSKSPAVNITAHMGTDLNVETILKNKVVYVNVKEVPLQLQSMIGMFVGLTTKDYTNRWFSYDLKEVDSAARQTLEAEKKTEDNALTALYDEIYKRLYAGPILKNTKVTSEKLDGTSVYKLTLDANEAAIKEIYDEMKKINDEKLDAANIDKGLRVYDESLITVPDFAGWIPSDLDTNMKDLKNVKVEAYFNKKDYVMKQINIILKSEIPDSIGSLGYGLGASAPSDSAFSGSSTKQPSKEVTKEVTVAFTLKMDKVGEKVSIEVPSNVTTFKDFINEITTKAQEKYLQDIQSGSGGSATVPLTPGIIRVQEKKSDTVFGNYIN
jgi:hypothetical protein